MNLLKTIKKLLSKEVYVCPDCMESLIVTSYSTKSKYKDEWQCPDCLKVYGEVK